MASGQSLVARFGRGLGSRTFQALQIPNYRRYFAGQTISATGTWVQLVAEQWLVIRLGGGGLALGVTTALQFTPLLVLGPFAGVVVDRSDKRRLLVLTQSANGALALALSVLAVAGALQIWMIWVAALLLGCVNSVDIAGRQALTKEMVGPAAVANAVSLNTAIANVARAVGPAIGGVLLATVGSTLCFLLNAVSYGVVVACLLAMRRSEFHAIPTVARAKGQVREGLRYARERPELWIPLVTLAVVSTFALNYQVVLPLLVSAGFHQGPSSYGAVMSMLGVGSTVGALVAATLGDPGIRRLGVATGLFAFTALGIALSPALAIAFPIVGLMGVCGGLFLSTCAGCMQRNSDGEMLGRVMSLYYMALLGVSPLAGPLVGAVAQSFGVRAAFLLAAAACSVTGAVLLTVRIGRDRQPR